MNKNFAPLALACLIASSTGPVFAGNLTPPGAPAPTMVTLDQLNAAVAGATSAANDAQNDAALAQDPRVAVDTLPGNASAVRRITAPGSYYLRGDVVGVSGSSGIEITASDVTLDLNGFTVRGVPGALSGIRFSSAGDLRGISIRNGVVADWPGAGITNGGAFFVSASHMEDVTIANCLSGVSLWSNSAFVRVIAQQNSGNGISVGSSALDHCVARLNGGAGFTGSGSFDQCQATSNTGDGFNVSQGTASHCMSQFNSGDGFELGGSFSLSESRSLQNSLHGINVSGDNSTVEHCAANLNGTAAGTQSGIVMAGTRGVVDSCSVVNNMELGVNATGTLNLIVRNRAGGNPFGNYVFAASNSNANQVAPVANFATAEPWANFFF